MSLRSCKTIGLKQGINELKVYAMCEIPANVILADEFLKIFDGYSIGSNDLTQLTLGVDRGSELISHVFDERNEAVKRMIKMAIQACKKEDKIHRHLRASTFRLSGDHRISSRKRH